VREYTGDPVKLTVTNAAEQTVANLTAPGTPGLNRVVWDLKPSNDVLTQYGGEGRKIREAGRIHGDADARQDDGETEADGDDRSGDRNALGSLHLQALRICAFARGSSLGEEESRAKAQRRKGAEEPIRWLPTTRRGGR